MIYSTGLDPGFPSTCNITCKYETFQAFPSACNIKRKTNFTSNTQCRGGEPGSRLVHHKAAAYMVEDILECIVSDGSQGGGVVTVTKTN